MNSELGNWLSGYIDAKGHFSVKPCRFKLYSNMCDLIRDFVGFGTVHSHKTGQYSWEVQSKADCLALTELLDLHPLRSSKQTEYLVWRRAVVFWNQADNVIDRKQAMDFLEERLKDVRLSRKL